MLGRELVNLTQSACAACNGLSKVISSLFTGNSYPANPQVGQPTSIRMAGDRARVWVTGLDGLHEFDVESASAPRRASVFGLGEKSQKKGPEG